VATIYVPFFQRVLHTTPLSLADWGMIAAWALPVFLIPEAVKWIRWRARAEARSAA
jgi:P-type Ca2+ transporter type 2C